MKKNELSALSTPKERLDEANNIINTMAEAGIITTEHVTCGNKKVEVLFSSGAVVCELDENNRTKKSKSI